MPSSQEEARRGRRRETEVREEADKAHGGASEMKAAGGLCAMVGLFWWNVGDEEGTAALGNERPNGIASANLKGSWKRERESLG